MPIEPSGFGGKVPGSAPKEKRPVTPISATDYIDRF
jgi:hypothetical protein